MLLEGVELIVQWIYSGLVIQPESAPPSPFLLGGAELNRNPWKYLTCVRQDGEVVFLAVFYILFDSRSYMWPPVLSDCVCWWLPALLIYRDLTV